MGSVDRPGSAATLQPNDLSLRMAFWWDYGTGETGNWGCHILDIPFWALGLKSSVACRSVRAPGRPATHSQIDVGQVRVFAPR